MLTLRFAENQVEEAGLASRSRLPEQFLGTHLLSQKQFLENSLHH